MSDVISGILSEDDVIRIPDDTLSKFMKLLNTALLTQVKKYVSAASRADVKSKLEGVAGEHISSGTFHIDVKDKQIRRLLRENSIYVLADEVFNGNVYINEYVDALAWLVNNEGNIKSTIMPRDKDLFDEVVWELKLVNTDHNLPKIMMDYKQVLFCPARERETDTGLKDMVRKKAQLRMTYKAALYLKHCMERGVSKAAARIVN